EDHDKDVEQDAGDIGGCGEANGKLSLESYGRPDLRQACGDVGPETSAALVAGGGRSRFRDLRRSTDPLWHLPDLLCAGAVAAILAVRHDLRPDRSIDRDHQGRDRVRSDVGLELGRDSCTAQDTGCEPRLL